MWNSQVFNVERPSKRSTPRITASHVSWVTSSATARLPTVVWARRSMRGWYRSINATNADSSPAAKAVHQLSVVVHGA